MTTLLARHPRYQNDWFEPFHHAAMEALEPGSVVLDIGGGRRPALNRSMLPNAVRYIGLDLSMAELESAAPCSYDEMIEADIRTRIPALEQSVDLAICWQVLEHVAPLATALDNVRSYLRPGGRFVAQLSGGRALFAILNRAIPHSMAVVAMKRLLGRDPATVFPASYDACTYSGLVRLLRDWSMVEVLPRYRGAQYFSFAPPVQRAYLKAEDMMASGRHRDLATHYLIVAEP